MPQANGILGNCVKLTINGALIGYFPNEDAVNYYVKIREEVHGLFFREVKIEPWFIEGEF